MFNKNIAIEGKQAYYISELMEHNFFPRIIDVYMNAAVVGFRYNRISEVDKNGQYKDLKKSIFAEQLINESTKLDFLYRLIILLHDKDVVELEERIKRAFRDDSSNDLSEKHLENMSIFNSYVLGGIEVLYEKLIEAGATKEDYMRNAYLFMKEQEIEGKKRSSEDLINDL